MTEKTDQPTGKNATKKRATTQTSIGIKREVFEELAEKYKVLNGMNATEVVKVLVNSFYSHPMAALTNQDNAQPAAQPQQTIHPQPQTVTTHDQPTVPTIADRVREVPAVERPTEQCDSDDSGIFDPDEESY